MYFIFFHWKNTSPEEVFLSPLKFFCVGLNQAFSTLSKSSTVFITLPALKEAIYSRRGKRVSN